MNPTVIAAELPQHFYYIVGFLILTNIGAIGSLLMVAAKAIWWASALTVKVDTIQTSATNAHERINKITGERAKPT